MMPFTFHIVTFGCKVNQYESDLIRGSWLAKGGTECSDPEGAQYICVNSCAITSNAERESRNAIYRAKRCNPKACVILTGCAAKLIQAFRPRKNAEWLPPDLIVANKNILLGDPREIGVHEVQETIFPPGQLCSAFRSRPVVKLQDGCSQNCTYCIVPQTRGRPTSRQRETVLAEISAFFAAGYGEIVLSGINLRQYGQCGDFWDLLNFLEQSFKDTYGDRRLRLSSLDPAMLNARGLETLANCSLVCPHVHLSIQHGSDAILRKMGRGHYKANEIISRVQELSSIWDKFALGADFITGFPGETEKDADLTAELINKLPFSYAHIFPFSARPGTPAARFQDQVPKKLKNERSLRLRQIMDAKRLTFLESQIGAGKMTIAAEKGSGETGKGVNEYYVPCYFLHFSEDTGLFKAQPIKLYQDGIWVEPHALHNKR